MSFNNQPDWEKNLYELTTRIITKKHIDKPKKVLEHLTKLIGSDTNIVRNSIQHNECHINENDQLM